MYHTVQSHITADARETRELSWIINRLQRRDTFGIQYLGVALQVLRPNAGNRDSKLLVGLTASGSLRKEQNKGGSLERNRVPKLDKRD